MFASFGWTRAMVETLAQDHAQASGGEAAAKAETADGVEGASAPSCSSSESSECDDLAEGPVEGAPEARPAGCSEAAGAATPPDPPPLVTAPVRDKAAYFEALIRSNAAALLRGESGSAPGPHEELDPGPGLALGDAPSCGPGEGDVLVALRLPPPRRAHEAPEPEVGSEGSLGPIGEGCFQLGSSSSEASALRERCERLEAALARREAESANLLRVVKELSESRVKAVCARASLAERQGALQAELARLQRIAELSRTVSKENVARTSRAQSALRAAQREVRAQRGRTAQAEARAEAAEDECGALREKIGLLRRLEFKEGHRSVCMRYFTDYRVGETY